MTRDYNCDGIAIVGHADGAKGMRFADGARDVGVGTGLAVRNRQQSAPAGQLEIRATEVEWKGELAARTGKIFFELLLVEAHCLRRLVERHLPYFLTKIPGIGTNRWLSWHARIEFKSDHALI